MKKLLISFTGLIFTALLFVMPIYASSVVTFVEDQNGEPYMYVHFGDLTNSNHVTDIGDANTVIQAGYGTFYENATGRVDFEVPDGAGRFVIENGSGQIIHIIDLDAGIYPIEIIELFYENDYLVNINNDYNWPGGYYGKFYFVHEAYTGPIGQPADELEPVIDGQTAFVTNIDNPITEAAIRSEIHAIDETDGDITHLIQLDSTDYNPETAEVGDYIINYSVADSAGNYAWLDVHVLVRDVSAPVVDFASSTEISYTQELDIEQLKADILSNTTDNYYDTSELTITVKQNEYTSNKSTPMSTGYPITFEIKDPSNNITDHSYRVFVVDDVPPIVSYNEVIIKPLTSNLNLADIMADITANDLFSGDVIDTLEVVSDYYTGYGNKVGEYQIEFEVHDDANNYQSFIVTVKVIDNLPPVFMVTPNKFIRVENTVSLTNEDIIDILTRTGQLDLPAETPFVYMTNEYLGNEELPGLYAMSMKFTATTGEVEVQSFVIEVMEGQDYDGVIDDDRDFFTKIWDYALDNPLNAALIALGSLVFIGAVIILLTRNHDAKPKHLRKNKYSDYRRK